ncbi:hypothetical protein D3C74_183300 [compost metagenome]
MSYKKPYLINVIIVLLIIIYLIYVVISATQYGSTLENLKYDFSNIMYQNQDTTTLYLYYYDDGLETDVFIYFSLFTITMLLLFISFMIHKSKITLFLLINIMLCFSLLVYPYFHLMSTADFMLFTSIHFLLLTSYLNDYSLYIFIPYYTLLIVLTVIFVCTETPIKRLRIKTLRGSD